MAKRRSRSRGACGPMSFSWTSSFPVSLALTLPSIAAFAEAQVEPPMESAGPGAIIGFGVVTVVLIAAYVWYTARASRKERELAAVRHDKSAQA